MDKLSKEKRSPLKRKALRNPGESLHLERQQLIQDEWIPYVFLAVMMVLVASVEWLRWNTKVPPRPLAFSVVALLAVVNCTYKFITVRKQNGTLRFGEEREKTVGHSLEDLRNRGCRVFHDVVGDGFNIDHVADEADGMDSSYPAKLGCSASYVEYDPRHSYRRSPTGIREPTSSLGRAQCGAGGGRTEGL